MNQEYKTIAIVSITVLVTLLICSALCYNFGYERGVLDVQQSRAADYTEQYQNGYNVGYGHGAGTVDSLTDIVENKMTEAIETVKNESTN